MSTKQNPGAYDCYAKLADDEPFFVLRAKDATAPATIEQWVQHRIFDWFSNHPADPVPPAYYTKLEEALKVADEMRAWRSLHVGETDADRESFAEQQSASMRRSVRRFMSTMRSMRDPLPLDAMSEHAQAVQREIEQSQRKPDDAAHERPTLKDA